MEKASGEWKKRADGIWERYNGTLYERPKISGRYTFRSLGTSSLKLAKEELERRIKERFSGRDPQPKPSATTVGTVIQRYQNDSYPDQHRQPRPPRMHSLERRNCELLLKFWANIPVDSVSTAECDRYHDWRVAHIKFYEGHRSVDLELNTLSNAFLWACRSDLVKTNPLATRPRYCAEKSIKHCRDFMPVDATELHKLVGCFFQSAKSEVLGWQTLVEAQTGLRTCEVLRLRTDAAPYTPGWITPDGKSLCVGRAKGQGSVNPFSVVHDGLRQTLDAFFMWKKKKYPKSPWFFPSHINPALPVGTTALAHALLRLTNTLGHQVRSHGLRAFYVLVRRSNGISDVQISYELGHTTGGATVAAVYGGCPVNWLAGDGPKMKWLPEGEPAWETLKLSEQKASAAPAAPSKPE